jgi:peptidoglycan hydrolase-like protein with peptidoglycan-binding domain
VRATEILCDEINAAGGVTTPAPEAGFVVRRILKTGIAYDEGDDVRELQAALIARGYACGPERRGLVSSATTRAQPCERFKVRFV